MQTPRRTALVTIVIALLLVVSGCRDGPLRYELDVRGCLFAWAHHEPSNRTVLDVVARCPAVADPSERILAVVWARVPNEVSVIVVRADDRPSTVVTRADLQRRHGTIGVSRAGDSDVLWLLILLLLPTALLPVVVLLGRAAARAGVAVLIVRR